jgi:hypothetical protein
VHPSADLRWILSLWFCDCMMQLLGVPQSSDIWVLTSPTDKCWRHQELCHRPSLALPTLASLSAVHSHVPNPDPHPSPTLTPSPCGPSIKFSPPITHLLCSAISLHPAQPNSREHLCPGGLLLLYLTCSALCLLPQSKSPCLVWN